MGKRSRKRRGVGERKEVRNKREERREEEEKRKGREGRGKKGKREEEKKEKKQKKMKNFFFQAEDGIRDSPVTGVQTCALPILDTFCTIPESVRSPNLCGNL